MLLHAVVVTMQGVQAVDVRGVVERRRQSAVSAALLRRSAAVPPPPSSNTGSRTSLPELTAVRQQDITLLPHLERYTRVCRPAATILSPYCQH